MARQLVKSTVKEETDNYNEKESSLIKTANKVFEDIIQNLDTSSFKDKSIIIKGCSNKPIPETAYIQIIEKLQPIVKSLMFGEACSNVPIFKA